MGILVSRAQLKILPYLMILGLSASLNHLTHRFDEKWVEPSSERRFKLNPHIFRTLSFGQLPAVIDWVWMTSLLMEENTSRVEPGTHPQLFYDLDLVSDLDPAFFEGYIAGANLLAVVRRDASGAVHLLNKGNIFLMHDLPHYPQGFHLKFWDKGWDIPLLLGYVYLFELEDMPQASQAFRQAARIPGSPDYLDRLAQRLERPGGEYEVGLKLINFLLTGAKEREVRKSLERKRVNLIISHYIYDLNQQFISYLKTIPGYQRSTHFSASDMESYWQGFLKRTKTQVIDPWGGTLSLDSRGQILTTTPYERVFGLP